MQQSVNPLAAVLSSVHEHLAIDRKALAQLDFRQVPTFGSGKAAADFLAEQNPRVVLVDATLEDMGGREFIRVIRRHHACRMVPIVMVTLDNRRESVMEAISAGCSGYVLRPYSIKTLERHLLMALTTTDFEPIEQEQLEGARELVTMGQFDDAIEEFEELLAEPDEAQRYFDMGTKYLAEEKYGKAIIAFNKALKINELFAEACKGMADAYKGKGDEGKYQQYLKQAAEIYAVQDRLQEAKEIFVEVLRSDPDAVNPYNTLGVKLRRKGDCAGAIHAYNQALEISPNDENLLYNIAKAHIHQEQYDKALGFISRALEQNSEFAEARAIYKKLAKKPWTGVSGPRREEGAGLDRDAD